MSITPFSALTCPLDGLPLQLNGASWQCASAHCFDVASQGYTNLLPVQHKRSRDPGDSKEMVAARRRFLESAVYAPIAERVAGQVAAAGNADGVLACLDAGCGEGYYLRELARVLDPTHALAILGLDISKWAVMAAARADRRMAWVVGSNAKLPVQSGSLDVVLCMFGFPVYGEFARVLKPGGLLLQVDAGADHLRELREIIYPSLKPEKPPVSAPPPGFTLADTDKLLYPVTLGTAVQIADLLTMTPHLYRASADGLARARALSTLGLSVDARFSLYRRQGG